MEINPATMPVKTYQAIKAVVIAIGLLCVMALLGAGSCLYWLSGPGYHAELNDVRARLDAIPGVRILELDGVDDLTLEHIRARIHIEGKGEMEIHNLGRDSFRNTGHLDLGGIGPHSLVVEGEGFVGCVEAATGKKVRSRFYGWMADIGPEGEFAHMFPFRINNVQTAVARYDEILKVIGSWPLEPSKQHFRDAKGTDFHFSIRKAKSSEPSSALHAEESGR